MSFSWKYKFIGLFIAVLASIYILLPTALGLNDKRAEYQAAGKDLPWHFALLPQQELNLGLDLRGGMYMELEVDVDEALEHQTELLAGDVRRYVIESNKLEGVTVDVISGQRMRVELKPSDVGTFKQQLVKVYGNSVLEISSSQLELFYKINGDAKAVRKLVLQKLDSVPDFSHDLSWVQDGQVLAVPFSNAAQKTQIQTALADTALASQIQPTTHDNTLYLTIAEKHMEDMVKNIIEQAANSVRNRIDRFGVAEASVSRQSSNRLVVELPGIKDPDSVINIIRRTGKLEFRLVADGMTTSELSQLIAAKVTELKIDEQRVYEKENLDKLNDALKSELPEDTEIAYELSRNDDGKVAGFAPFLLEKKAEVTGDMLDNASVQSDNNMPYVSMVFNKSGAKKFGDLTSDNIGRNLAIVLDGIVSSAPVIRSAITGGQAQIELGYGDYYTLQKEASDLVLILKEGALPASINVATKNIIGPSLGKESIESGMNALMIASIAVVVFMLLYYKVGGLVANIALLVNVLFIFAMLAIFQASLTLPGIAGIVLTMGMAVDANVIIFERMREELYLGHKAGAVVEAGYSQAMSAIVDGNITTFISGLVLFEFGTGPIKGFATTLMIGIVTTMITAIVLTRVIYDWMLGSLKMKQIRI